MTTEAAAEQPRQPGLWRLAHIAAPGYLIAGLAFVTADLTTSPYMGAWLRLPLLLATILLMLAHWRHQRALCGICAAMTPLDGNAAAQRRKLQLRLYHDGGIIGLIVLLVLGGVFVAARLLDWPYIIQRLALDLAFFEFALSAHVNITHRLLAPWCPYCDWDDGGDEEVAPEPITPVGQVTI